MKFIKTVFKVTIFHCDEDNAPAYRPNDLAVMAYDLTYGGCFGGWEAIEDVELTPDECAEGLEKFGTDPSFLLGEDF